MDYARSGMCCILDYIVSRRSRLRRCPRALRLSDESSLSLESVLVGGVRENRPFDLHDMLLLRPVLHGTHKTGEPSM